MSSTLRICSQLVLDSTYPDITFDKDGVCDQYHFYNSELLPRWPYPNNKANELDQLISKVKREGKNKSYDCIVGLSGGLDSSYMLDLIVNKYSLRPLVFHVDAGWNSDISVRNIHSLVNGLDLDLYTEVADWSEVKSFQLSLLRSGVPHIDLAQDMAFIAVLYQYARRFKIKYIFNGGNIATEGVMRPFKYFYWGSDVYHLKQIHKKFGQKKLKKFKFSSPIMHKFINPLLLGTKVIKPLNYIDYNKANALSYLKNKYGYVPYPEKHYESRFTRFYEGFWLRSRFDFDIRTVDYSSLILSGQMTREQALASLAIPPLDDLTISQEFNYVASKLDLSPSQLWELHRLPLQFYYDYPNSSRFFEFGSKVLSKFSSSVRGGSI